MKTIARFFFALFAVISLLLGGLHWVRVRSARGMAARSLKSVSEALSPFLAAAAAISAIASGLLGAPLAGLAGALGALLQAEYVRRVTRPQDAFTESFGQGWQHDLGVRLSPIQQQRILPNRWSWLPRTTEPTQNEPRWERDVIYRTIPGVNGSLDRELCCDLWQPPAGTPTSGLAIIYLHGGGFFTSHKDFGTRSFFRHLAKQGHVIMDADYRLAPTADLLEMLDDVNHAILWMKKNAEWLEADPDQIVLIGSSAGAHLALLAAYGAGKPRLTSLDLQEADLSVRAVVSYYGTVDLAATYRAIQVFMAAAPNSRVLPENWLDRPMAGKLVEFSAWVRAVEPSAMREYLHENQNLMFAGLEASMDRLVGGPPDEIPEVYSLISPITYAGPNCPPTLLLQGEHDHMLPLEPTRELHRKLRAAGVRSVYVELPLTEHTFDLFLPDVSPPALSALYDVDRFLMLIKA